LQINIQAVITREIILVCTLKLVVVSSVNTTNVQGYTANLYHIGKAMVLSGIEEIRNYLRKETPSMNTKEKQTSFMDRFVTGQVPKIPGA